MKDQRLYGKFTLTFASHHKILILSDAAFRCLVEATLWSREQQTDGFLASRLALAKWSLDALQELSTNDPVNPSLIAREEGWYIHDFAEHQETKADIQARRERNKLNGQKGGLARGKRVGKRPAKPVASDSGSEMVSEIEAEEEKGGARENVAPPTLASSSEPPLRCNTHMNHTDPPPCGRCASAREAHEAWAADDLRRLRATKDAESQRRKNCAVCEGTNWVVGTDPAVRCTHQEAVNQ